VSYVRANNHLAAMIRDDLARLAADYEAACDAGNFSRAQDIWDCIRETERSLFLTGTSSGAGE
jgi:hypothetical protein